MKGYVRQLCLVVAAALLVVACSKDEPSGSIAFSESAKYVEADDVIYVPFTATNVNASTFSVTKKPTGWEDPVVDAESKTIEIIIPPASAFGDDVAESGTVVLSGTVNGGSTVTASIFIGVVDMEDLSATPANSYLLNKKNTHYLLDANHKGESGETLATASIGVIWQTVSGLIQYLTLDDDKISFFIGEDADDDTRIKQGNALIGAYDTDGNLIWYWHIWATDFDADATALAYPNYTVMARNLGALDNANSTTAEKLASLGLYYQWGRNTPFVNPSTYTANNGTSAAMYNGSGTRVYLKTVASDAETGTMDYAMLNPLSFITVTSKSDDWCVARSSAAVWSGAKKSAYDPCPRGWQVAPAAAFDGLTIKEDLTADYSAYEDNYGWTLSNGSVEALYMGAGRRSYLDASVQNTFDESLLVRGSAMEAQPWVGYYWTTDTASNSQSAAFAFWFRKDNVSESGVRNNLPMGRANGMSVRCVKVK